MNIETIEKILNAEPIAFTATEIQELMDDELSKDPSEVDMKLVEKCLDILEQAIRDEKAEAKKAGDKKKHISITKILMVAVIVATFFVIALPVSAKYIDSNISNKIIHFYENHLSIDLRSDEMKMKHYPMNGNDFIKELNNNGFENVHIPDAMLKYNYSKDFILQDKDPAITFTINFVDVNHGNSGMINIQKTKDDAMFSVGNFDVFDKHDKMEILNVAGRDIVVLCNDKYVYLKYIIEDMEYSITFVKCNYNSAIEIANTLK